MPQNSNFRLLPVIDFSQKMEVTVMAPMGSHLVQKMGQKP